MSTFSQKKFKSANNQYAAGLNLISIPATVITLMLYPVSNVMGMRPEQALRVLAILQNEVPKSAYEDAAKMYAGLIPYKWGGTDPETGMDCSAFVRHVLQKFGVQIPRTTHQQATTGKKIELSRIMPGDLIFFDANPNRPGIDHVAIYIGNGFMAHSESPDGVKMEKLSTYRHKPVMARRMI
jgi:NlpC/P60 family